MAFEPVPARSIVRTLRLHPRVAYQGLFTLPEERDRMLAALPALAPFRRRYHGAIAIVDWDHRLPSRVLALRLYLYYEEASLAAGEGALDDRVEEIGVRDRYPEFDVPDFADLPADEAYEADLERGGNITACRLTSAWRREIEITDADVAVGVARGSEEFQATLAAATDRPMHLGDLEAVSWTPPCETGFPAWTVDVWYLLTFDGRVGAGRSLLVDPGEKRVVGIRDFTVRAG